MGRYYSGDINGKFWFGVQSSDDADHFGGERVEPSYIEYSFDESHLPAIEDGIATCQRELGEDEAKLTQLFNDGSYSDRDLMAYLGVDEATKQHLLELYARLELGRKILKSVKETGQCSFEAEI